MDNTFTVSWTTRGGNIHTKTVSASELRSLLTRITGAKGVVNNIRAL